MNDQKRTIRDGIDLFVLSTSYFAILLLTGGVTVMTHRTNLYEFSKDIIYSGLVVAILGVLGYRHKLRSSQDWGEQDSKWYMRFLIREAWRSEKGFASLTLAGVFTVATGWIIIIS